MINLYYHPLSGHSHRVRLFLSILGVRYELNQINFRGGENRSQEFLKLNPFGQVPVLEDDGIFVSDSNAILVYLAKRYGDHSWLPETPAGAAAVQRWLSVAAGEMTAGPARARQVTVFAANYDAKEVLAAAHGILALVDKELAGTGWIAAIHPTIADIALYSFIANAPEGNVDLSAYRKICDWLLGVEAIKGFVPFAKTHVGLVMRT